MVLPSDDVKIIVLVIQNMLTIAFECNAYLYVSLKLLLTSN